MVRAEDAEAPEDARAALAAVLAEIDEDVARHRADGDLPPQLERELDDLFLRYAPEAGGREGGASAALRMVEAAAFIDPVVPVASEKSGGAALKRTVRSLSLWYMGFVTAQVNQFAAAVTRCLHVLEDQVEELQRQMAAVQPATAPVVEVPWAHTPGAWWVPEALEACRAARGRVLHAAAGDGWLVQALVDHGVDAYGVDPRRGPVERAGGAGLDVREEDLLGHLGAVAPDALSGIVLSGVLDGMAAGARLQVVAAAITALAPGGVLAVHSLSPSSWAAEDAPVAADLSPGRPWRAATWVEVLSQQGLVARTVHEASDFLVVATRPDPGAAAAGAVPAAPAAR